MSTTPKGLITPTEIETLTQAYDDRYNAINSVVFSGTGVKDNRSSWFSLDDLRNYLTLVEGQAKTAGFTMDGVRIYPGAHPGDGEAPGLSTFLFVPTGYRTGEEGGGSGDLTEGNGLNKGTDGEPPFSNYPQ